MEFRISDTFVDSLAALTNQEQKAVKTTSFDLQMNPASPGIQLHRITNSRDDNFWSARVSRDIRLIVHRTSRSFLLCYVDHHDDAYAWAERRTIERHPKTGAAQIVEVTEMTREIPVYVTVEHEAPAQPEPNEQPEQKRPELPLFADLSEDDLLAYGVPPTWTERALSATESTVLDLAERLPGEAAEALLNLAVGERPLLPEQIPDTEDPFEHPDAQRRFRTVSGKDELERALDAPWDKWAVFLHPSQRSLVTRSFSGPARVSGSAGTGKTVVALHRAVYLADENEDARVLLTTFSDALAAALMDRLRILVSNRPIVAERIDVRSLDETAARLAKGAGLPGRIALREDQRRIVLEAAASAPDHPFSEAFVLSEWTHVIDAWQIGTLGEYLDVPRIGRKSRLPKARREALWQIFERAKNQMESEGLSTLSQRYSDLAQHFETYAPPYQHVVVDEAQDISVAQLRFLASLGGPAPDALFFAGDLGQRIFQPPFSWKALGVDVRGRSSTLRINYRTTHQIRHQADLLLDPEIADADGEVESRKGTTSVFNGPEPSIRLFDTHAEEEQVVGDWLVALTGSGTAPHEMGVIVRSEAEVPRAQAAVAAAGMESCVLDEALRDEEGCVSVCTMHLAKGLEYRTVAVMACDEDVVPNLDRLMLAGDDTDQEEIYRTERHLLYVACTRARDRLLVTGQEPGSDFLMDLGHADKWCSRLPPS